MQRFLQKKQPKPKVEWLRTKLRALGLVLLLVLALPYALTLVYVVVPPPSTLMLWDWFHLRTVHRQWVPLESISPQLVRAVLGAEDGAFCSHWGIDTQQLKRSLKRAEQRDRPVRATSTITQQTVKNLFLWHGRSWVRKLLETPLTVWMELTLSKARILEIYLNIAQWGPSLYGVEAASMKYFGVSSKHINLYQASQLATALPNPLKRRADKPEPAYARLSLHLMGRLQKASPDTACLK